MSDKHLAGSILTAFLDCPHKALLEVKGQAGQTDARELSINRRVASYRETVLQRPQQSTDESRRPDVKWIGFNRSPDSEHLLATEAAANSEMLQLDALFLTFPGSFKGRLVQYTGRVLREFPGKADAEVYDYADLRVPVLRGMYSKRLKAYKALGFESGTAGKVIHGGRLQ